MTSSSVTLHTIPNELRHLPQWVCYRTEPRGEKLTKVPVNPHTGGNASCDEPSTWASYQEAEEFCAQNKLSGIGFVFTKTDFFVGVDLDMCCDSKTGAIEAWAQEIIETLDSYTEFSPSGTGLHIIVKGTLPHGGRRKGHTEMYESGRYFTMTGKHVDGTPTMVEERTNQLQILHTQTFGTDNTTSFPRPSHERARPSVLSDEDILTRAKQARNGSKFSQLFDGDWSGYPSQSEADQALCGLLAFWTAGEANQLDRLYRQSKLMRPKWDEKRGDRTYGQITIENALSSAREFYQPINHNSSFSAGPGGPSGPESILEHSNPADRFQNTSGPKRSSGPDACSFSQVPGFRVAPSGVFKLSDDDKPDTQLTLAPVWIEALCRDGEGQHWGAFLRWTDRDERTHETAMPVGRFHEPHGSLAVELANAGLPIVPNKEKELLRYFASAHPTTRFRAAIQTGWQEEAPVFILPTGTIGDLGDQERVVFQPERYAPSAHSIRTKGTLEGWKENLARLCRNNPVLAFWVAAAFAAPLLKLLGLEGGGFHLFGTTSQGKTTAEQAAASVWGDGSDPAEGKSTSYVKKWNLTKNATEGLAEAHNDLPLCLDEIGEADSKEFGRTIYQLAGGQGKGRMRADATLKPSKVWRTLVLSTGEIPTSDVIEAEGRHVKGGQAVRLLDIPATDPQTALGVVVDALAFETPAELVDALKQACGRDFGWAGPAFVQALVEEGLESVRSECKTALDRIAQRLLPQGGAPEVMRAVKRFALVVVAGEKATDLSLLPWVRGETFKAVKVMLGRFLSSRGGVGSQTEQAKATIRDFLLAHGSSRLGDLQGDNSRVSNLAGYKDSVDHCFYLTPKGFQEACKGHNKTDVARLLKQRGLLQTPDDRHLTTRINIPGGGRTRVYSISEDILDEET